MNWQKESLALRDFSIRRAATDRPRSRPTRGLVRGGGNRGDLQQVLLNLLMNAEQALAGTTGTIVVQLTVEDGAVVLRVIDEGPGVALTRRSARFEPFVSTHEPFESAGLGLWAARSLVERHGGTLTIEGRPAGAAFAMRLPAVTRSVRLQPAHSFTEDRSQRGSHRRY